MNRNDAPLFDARVADWLEEDPDLAPRGGARGGPRRLPIDQAAARLACRGGPSSMPAMARSPRPARRSPWWPWGPWPCSGRWAPGRAGRRRRHRRRRRPQIRHPRRPRRPRPSVSLSTPAPRSSPVSDRSGFTIARPPDWTEHPADHDWTLAEAANVLSTGHEHFEGPQGKVGMGAWTYDPGPDVSLETIDELVAWARSSARVNDSTAMRGFWPIRPCPYLASNATAIRPCSSRSRTMSYAFVPGYAEDGSMIIVGSGDRNPTRASSPTAGQGLAPRPSSRRSTAAGTRASTSTRPPDRCGQDGRAARSRSTPVVQRALDRRGHGGIDHAPTAFTLHPSRSSPCWRSASVAAPARPDRSHHPRHRPTDARSDPDAQREPDTGPQPGGVG